MSLIRDYLAENASFIQGDTAVAIEQIPETAWPHILEALDELSGGATAPGIDCDVFVTHETLEDFVHSRTTYWSEPGRFVRLTFGGYAAMKFLRFQMRRGQPRGDMLVVDLGEFRVILK